MLVLAQNIKIKKKYTKNISTLALVKHGVETSNDDEDDIRVYTVIVRAIQKIKRMVVLADEMSGSKSRGRRDISGLRSRV